MGPLGLGPGPELPPLGQAIAVPRRARAPAEPISDLLSWKAFCPSPEVGTIQTQPSSLTGISHLAVEGRMKGVAIGGTLEGYQEGI